MIIKSLENLYKKRNLIERYIESVDDSELRIILRLRYIHFYSWGNIAYKIKAKGESTPRMKVNKFFEENLTEENNVINIKLTNEQKKYIKDFSTQRNEPTINTISYIINYFIEKQKNKENPRL